MAKKSKHLKKWMAGGLGVLTVAAGGKGLCAEASNPLLNALIKKGILTQQEANDIQAETATNSMTTSMPQSKWKLSKTIKSIGLYGDVRFRYEYRGAQNTVGAKPDTYYRERFRYALRAGIRGDLFDNFNYGIRIETSSNPRSTWVTFADDTHPTPSAKNSDGIGVGQIYLGWHPEKWFEMTVGKMPNPLYTTTMVWDSDINPEGAFEKFNYSFKSAELFADFGQFIYQDTNPDVAIPSSDTWLLAWQVGANIKLPKKSSLRVAPVVYTYAGHGANDGLNLPYTGQGNTMGANPGISGFGAGVNNAAFNENGINDLLVVEVPVQYTIPVGAYHGRFFGDFAYNINGAQRARAAYAASQLPTPTPGTGTPLSHPYTGENKAYQVGFAFGNLERKRNTWEAQIGWQHTEQYALDVNLIDSDIFEGRANLEGFWAGVSYSLTDSIVGSVRYAYAQRINDHLGTGGNNGDLPGLNPIKHYNLLQLDLAWKF